MEVERRDIPRAEEQESDQVDQFWGLTSDEILNDRLKNRLESAQRDAVKWISQRQRTGAYRQRIKVKSEFDNFVTRKSQGTVLGDQVAEIKLAGELILFQLVDCDVVEFFGRGC